MNFEARKIYERMQLMLDAAPMAISFFNKDLDIIQCNQEVVKMFCLTSKEDYINKLYQLMPPYQPDGTISKKAFKEMISQAFSKRYTLQKFVYQRMDGVIIHTETTFVRVRHEGENIVIGYTQDQSDKYQAQGREQEAIATSKLMLDAMPLACFLVRKDFKALDCNEAAVTLFGFANKKEALERYREIYPKTNPNANKANFVSSVKSPSYLEITLESGYSNFEYTHQCVDGSLIPCEVTLVRLDFHGESVVAAYLKDLRPIKDMAAKVKYFEVIEEENRTKTQFLARMSHEIRTPVSVIAGTSAVELRKTTHSSETREAFLQIQRSSELLTSIIDDILDLSKVAAGKMKIINKPYDTASLIVDSLQFNRLNFGSNKNIALLLDVDEHLPTNIIGDELRIKQILNNILSNAFKYTEEGTIALSFKIETISDYNDKIYLDINVSDTGQGMTQDQVDCLFTEYSRFNEEENRHIVGTGLGMSITYQLVNMMDGEITATSKLGEGTIVSVRIPQLKHGDQVLGEELTQKLKNYEIDELTTVKKESFTYEAMPYGKVLVVDDLTSNLYVAKNLLKPYELTVDTTSSGQSAIDMIKSGNVYDIVFMDHMMPDMDGMDAVRHLRNLGYNHPIVALTANAILGQEELLLKNGFDDFISKPIELSRLNGCLVKFIRDKYSPKISQNLSAGLTNSFIRDAQPAITTLKLCLDKLSNETDDEALKSYIITTHGMKSALIYIEQQALSKEADILEEAGKEKNLDVIKEKTQPFIDRLTYVVEALIESSGGACGEDTYDEDPIFLYRQLKIICEACKNYNIKVAKNALEQLMQKNWSKETTALFDKISVFLLHSEFEEAIEYIQTFL